MLVLEPDRFMRGYVGAALVGAGAQLICLTDDLEEARSAMTESDNVQAALIGVAEAKMDHWNFADQLARSGTRVVLMFARQICIPLHLCGVPHLLRPFAAFQAVDAIASLVEDSK